VRKALFKLQILDHYRATHYLGFKCIHVKILLRFWGLLCEVILRLVNIYDKVLYDKKDSLLKEKD
jgi:hypothetical protein